MPRGTGAMMPTHYKAMAEIVNKLSMTPELRLQVADHFATEFRKRFSSFDPSNWEKVTGGKIQGYDIRKGQFLDGTK